MVLRPRLEDHGAAALVPLGEPGRDTVEQFARNLVEGGASREEVAHLDEFDIHAPTVNADGPRGVHFA